MNFEEPNFKGRRVDDNRLVYGDLLTYRVYPVIFDKNKKQHEVLATTLGQFTGMYDDKISKKYPNGRPIYAGDIFKLLQEKDDELEELRYEMLNEDSINNQ